jgi:glycerate kinase
MKKTIVIAPDSFKNCLQAVHVSEYLAKGIQRVFPGASIVQFPLADGGDGTLDCIQYHKAVQKVHLQVSNPMHRPVYAQYLLADNGKTAIIELASASGIELLKKSQHNVLTTSTYGTGELIRHALHQNVQHIILTLGGSATVDGGMGIAQALGFRFYDDNHSTLKPCGANLLRISKIDSSDIDQKLTQTRISIAVDVQNVLNGNTGAAAVYAPQKGASKNDVVVLQKGLLNLSGIIKAQTGFDADKHQGTGAAGGAALFLLAYARANLVKGFDCIADITQFNKSLTNAEWIITGEGKIDNQTSYGKVLAGVCARAHLFNVRPIAVAGMLNADYEHIIKHFGLEALYSITDLARNKTDSLKNADKYLVVIGEKIGQMLKNKQTVKNRLK